LLSFGVIGGGFVGEFLVKGLMNGEIPKKGTVGEDVLKEISEYPSSVPSFEDEELIGG
jgi:hypothetical protein